MDNKHNCVLKIKPSAMEAGKITDLDIEMSKLWKCVMVVGGRMMCDVARAMYSSKRMKARDGAMTLQTYINQNNIAVNFQDHDQTLLNCNILKRPFDITFAYTVIREVCTGIFQDLSKHCKEKLSSFIRLRNDISHDLLTNLSEECIQKHTKGLKTTIRDVYSGVAKTLNKGLRKREYYNFEDKIEEQTQSVDKIMHSKLNYKQSGELLGDIRNDITYKVIEMGVKDIMRSFDKCKILHPCTWSDDKGEIRFDLGKVYTYPELTHNKSKINFSKLLLQEMLIEDEFKVPQAIVIQGEAGTGKTALCHFILHAWRYDPSCIMDVKRFHLVIFIEVCKISEKTFEEFLKVQLLKKTFHELMPKDVMNALLDLELLIVIDGFDEGNKHSSALVRDIFQKFKDKKIIITTRACTYKKLTDIITCYKIQSLQIDLLGFGTESRKSYIQKVFKATLKHKGEGQEKFEMYLEGRGKMLGKHLNLPLTIALLIVLWMDNPDNVNSVTTVTSLYVELFQMFQRKLIHRLIFSGRCRQASELQDVFDKLLITLGEQAWSMLKEGTSVHLAHEFKDKIADECKKTKMHVDATEFLCAYLKCELDENGDQTAEEYYFLHKTQTEYLAALFLASCICEGKSLEEIEKEVDGWQQYEQVLVYLIGSLAHKKALKGLEENVLNLVKKAEVDQSNYSYWWSIVSESSINYQIRKMPEPVIQYQNLIYPKIGEKLASEGEFLSQNSAWHPDYNDVAAALRLIALIPVKVTNLKIEIPENIEPFEIPDFLEAIEEVGKHRNSRRHRNTGGHKNSRRHRNTGGHKNSRKECIEMEMFLRKHWTQTGEYTSDRFLLATESWATLKIFEGSLSDSKEFQTFEGLRNISCRVTSLEVLSSFLSVSRSLRVLRLMIDFSPDTVFPHAIQTLSYKGDLEICFNRIKDQNLEWMLNVIDNLSRHSIKKLHLRQNQLSYKSIEKLVKRLDDYLTDELELRQPIESDMEREERLSDMARFTINWRR